MNTAAPSNYPMATLYVGDLAPDVNEAVLFDKFSATGPVVSIRVCRDLATRRSLGYAYVNFQQSADAERALDTMNFQPIKGRPCRIRWRQRDPSLRRSGVGNISIKNLDKCIDNKALYDTFSAFGNILTCKIALDENEVSKGFGYVHFETQEAANQAIEKVNGMLLNHKKVYVGMWMSRKERLEQLGDHGARSDDTSEESLRKMLEPYGDIQSLKVMLKEDGFSDPDSALKAVEEFNEKEINGRQFFCGRAQKRAERQAELRRPFQQQKMERINQFQGVNLFIKNLEETIDDDRLRKEFESYGTITSTKVMRDENGNSKGFGFVCFQSPEEATKAMTEKNGQIVRTKPLYVALAQRKEERDAQLAAQHMQRVTGMITPQAVEEINDKEINGRQFICERSQKRAETEAQFGRRFQQQKMERINQFQGVNLYIKNLEGTIDDNRLRKEFESYGTITSAKVMRDENGNSKGFGFVCFQSPEEATKAMTEKNGQIVRTKPLYVALAQRKEERDAQLAAQHMQRVTGRITPQGCQPVGQMFTGGFDPMATFQTDQRPSMFQQQTGVRPRFQTQPVRPGGYPQMMNRPRGPCCITHTSHSAVTVTYF